MSKVSRKSASKPAAKKTASKTPARAKKPAEIAPPAHVSIKPVPVAPVDVTPPLEPSAPPTAKMTKESRHRMIAEAAYYMSLKKGPSSDPRANWVEAERQIDAQLQREGR